MSLSAVPTGLVGGIGRVCYRHRWLTLLAWVAAVACLVTLWINVGAAARDNFTGSDPGQAVLNAHFPRQSGDSLTLAIRSQDEITSPAVRSRVNAALTQFAPAAHVTSVIGPYTAPGQISRGAPGGRPPGSAQPRDGHIAFATIGFDEPGANIPGNEAAALMNTARAASADGVRFYLGGDIVDQAETPSGGSSDGIGIGAAALVLLIAFGSLLAMCLPVATAVFGIGAGLSLISLVGHVFPAPSFSPIIASMIGLGVGIDYALFIVTRFRESLRGGAAAEDAVVTSMRTAGRSVLTAGTTVVIGMLGLLVLRQQLLNGVAVAAAVTVAATMLGALTLLPALLSFTGTRLAKPSRLKPGMLRIRRDRGVSRPAGSVPAAQRWARAVQRRPVTAAVLSAAAILALASPILGMKLNMPDESTQARGSMGYQSYATMARGFGPGFDAPLIVAAELPAQRHRVGPRAALATDAARLGSAISRTPGVAHVTEVTISRDQQAAMMVAYPSTGEQDTATNALVKAIRSRVLPAATAGTGLRAYLTGPNAGAVDFANMTGSRLPWLIAVVVALSMVLLVAVFRSIVIAVKAAVMNLLSISAAYGALVLVTQHGWLRQVFGFPETMPVTTWVPIFLFVILFGLSMDYEVFLLSRIREAYDRSGDNAAAVAQGLASTARVISAAAAIMVVVFLSVVLGADVSVKQIGLGLAVAVLIDATLVRLVLVPAAMEMLGKANWWLPRPLARMLPASGPRPGPRQRTAVSQEGAAGDAQDECATPALNEDPTESGNGLSGRGVLR